MADFQLPPICPTCNVPCVWESSTPQVGSGVVLDRTYCPLCNWTPEV